MQQPTYFEKPRGGGSGAGEASEIGNVVITGADQHDLISWQPSAPSAMAYAVIFASYSTMIGRLGPSPYARTLLTCATPAKVVAVGQSYSLTVVHILTFRRSPMVSMPGF